MNSPRLSSRWPMIGGAGLTLAILCVALFLNPSRRSQAPPAVYGSVSDFSLTNQLGEVVGLSELKGKIWLADIIFTRCAGPCPKLTRVMADLNAALADFPSVHFVSLTADAAYDTPAVLKGYAEDYQASGQRWWFLTGQQKAIYDLAVHGLKLAVKEKSEEERENPQDLFIHSTVLTLVDQQGRLRGFFEGLEPETKTRVIQAVKALSREG